MHMANAMVLVILRASESFFLQEGVNILPKSQLVIREEEAGKGSRTRSSGSGQKGKLKKLAKGRGAGGSLAVTRVSRDGSAAKQPKRKRNEAAVGSRLVKYKPSEIVDKGKGKIGETSDPSRVVTVTDGKGGSRVLELHKPAMFFNREESWAFVESPTLLKASIQVYDMAERMKTTRDLEEALAAANRKATRLRNKLRASEEEVRKLRSEKLAAQALAKSYEDYYKLLNASVKGREECVAEIEKLVDESKKVIADGKMESAEEGVRIRQATRADLINL